MDSQNDAQQIEDAGDRVCYTCFGDEFLKRAIRRSGKKRKCSYCGKTRVTLPLEKVADLFEFAINTYYAWTWAEAWGRDGQPVLTIIQEIGDAKEEVAEAIREELESRHVTQEDYRMGNEAEFSSESWYENVAVSSGKLAAEWTKFEHSLKSESRYFGRDNIQLLERIFSDLEKHRTYKGQSVIVDAGPDTQVTALYRARVFQSKASLLTALQRPEISIGPPPSQIAAAGRMNAQGIPVFYGATQPQVALAEVRPPVGSKVVVAKFDIIRPLRLLDVESLQNLSRGSLFDPKYLSRAQKAAFLEELSERITIPVVPEDASLEYIATQVIAEYLASLDNPGLDGMTYPSVQVVKGMKNVVLFHKAAVVASVIRPENVEIHVSSEEVYDVPVIEYSVVEEFDSEAVSPPPKESSLEEIMAEEKSMIDPRLPALKLAKEDVWVHHIQSVAITPESYHVSSRESDKKDSRAFMERMKIRPNLTLEDIPNDF